MEDWALDTCRPATSGSSARRPREMTWEKDGEKPYGYTMAVTELKLMTAKAHLKQRGAR